MVCNRCITVVRQEFDKMNLYPLQVKLGEVELQNSPDTNHLNLLNENLKRHGFEILSDKRQEQIEKTKNLIIEKVQSGDIPGHFVISEYLSKSLNKEYSHITRLFSEVEGVTIEQFFILQKIEKIKEWIVYGELTLSEIAWKLGYSSIAHLSAQFKKMTGLAPSHFKNMGVGHRKSLDKI